MIWVGVDDTDSREGMCTTYLAGRLLQALPEMRAIGHPRLVRLNPNVAWKTRGNAAVATAFDGPLPLEAVAARVDALVASNAQAEAEGTEPGWAVTRTPPAPAWYWRCVREVVSIDEAFEVARACGALVGGMKSRRGVIGALAAIAWPAQAVTFERIAYRAPDAWGSPRDVDEAGVRALEARFPATFDSYDVENEEVVMVPSSPCPVLWGVRGERARDVEAAGATVRGEAPDRFTTFVTNQATDDHLVDRACAQARAFESVRVAARVVGDPVARGGHVFVRLRDETGAISAAAYAPTRAFRRVLGALRAGDEVVACGGVHAGPDGGLTIGVEKLRVRALVPVRAKVANPVCARCGKHQKSAGAGQGYRCRACGTRAPPDAAAFVDVARALRVRWYEVPACARRHLAMPLKRMNAEAGARVGAVPRLPLPATLRGT